MRDEDGDADRGAPSDGLVHGLKLDNSRSESVTTNAGCGIRLAASLPFPSR